VPTAQFLLGVMNYLGEVQTIELAEAVGWIQKAAEQDYAEAQAILAMAYANGRGVQKDPAESAKWYLRSARRGTVAAQFALGLAYQNGSGVTQDTVESLAWFSLAARAGEKGVAEWKAKIEAAVPEEVRSKAKRRSEELLAQIDDGQRL